MTKIGFADGCGVFGKRFHIKSPYSRKYDLAFVKTLRKFGETIENIKKFLYTVIMTVKITQTDIQILEILQIDSARSLDSISEEIGVSLNTCWRRVKALEEAGVLEGRVALLDNEKVGLPLTVFVSVRTDDHSKNWADVFDNAVRDMPEIVEFYRLAGDTDYIMKMMVASVAHYDKVYQRLISRVSISDVSASFAMEKLKFTTQLPLSQVAAIN